MKASVQLGLLLALATAFVSLLGFLYKQRGAVELETIEWRRPVRAVELLFSNRWFVLGIAVAMASWGLHVAALSLAPISLVQSVIAGGLVLLTVMAERLFGIEVSRPEWIGVALCAVGLVFLAATVGDAAHDKHSDYTGSTLAAYDVLLVGASLGLMWLPPPPPPPPRRRRRAAARRRRRTGAGGRRRAAVGRIRRDDQGAVEPPGRRRDRRRRQSAGLCDPRA